MKHVDIYTDGACKYNPGPGGYGVVMVYNGAEKELSGGEKYTTNNRMELLAAITGLKMLKEKCEVTLYSDSKYLIDSIQKGWVYLWQKNGWRKGDKSPALNPDLWQELLLLLEKHEVSLVWVKGHNGHEYNERCDKLAVAGALAAMEDQ